MGIKAAVLRTGQKFTTRLTKLRGIVADIKQIVSGHSETGEPTLTGAPRVILVGGPNGVIHKTLHPEVIVDFTG